ncbi:MAG TPA: hypothetical protein VK539_15935 [Myxococcaceae bacterium]|nr:hypothetical protein [Myxococcaceae bacterium]
MSIRVLVWGAVVLGAMGQLACTAQADAAQFTSTETSSDPATGSPSGEGQFCGGFGGIQCPEGLRCVDDPNDSCEPTEGGADCGGICASADAERKAPKCERKEDPRLSYVSRDPEQCLAILFLCPEGSTQFFNECGCGCRRLDKTCNYTDPNRRYVSTDPDQCATLRFVCEPGEGAFSNSCGCGCEPATAP